MEIKVLHSKYESTKESQVLREILHQNVFWISDERKIENHNRKCKHNVQMRKVKLLRAQGECLGTNRR